MARAGEAVAVIRDGQERDCMKFILQDQVADLVSPSAWHAGTLRDLTQSPEKLDLLATTTAGYLVANYLLGIGDGHCDNAVLTRAGALVRIDYGFCFGDRPTVDSPLLYALPGEPAGSAQTLVQSGSLSVITHVSIRREWQCRPQFGKNESVLHSCTYSQKVTYNNFSNCLHVDYFS